MNTGTTVFAIAASGVLGGVAGAFLARECAGPVLPQPAAPASASPDRDASLEKEIAALRARLDEVTASSNARADETAWLREETARIRQDFDAERKAGAESRERLGAVEAGPLRHAMLRAAGGPEITSDLPLALMASRADGPAAEKMKKVFELRQKPEEERWTAARDALGLSAYQEEELKAAIKERNEANRAAIKVETKEAPGVDGSAQISLAIPDATKMVEARKKYDDRVNAALSADQSKKWRDDGYEGALGGGMRAMGNFVSVQADAISVEGK